MNFYVYQIIIIRSGLFDRIENFTSPTRYKERWKEIKKESAETKDMSAHATTTTLSINVTSYSRGSEEC